MGECTNAMYNKKAPSRNVRSKKFPKRREETLPHSFKTRDDDGQPDFLPTAETDWQYL